MQQTFHCFLLMITIIYSHFLSTAAQAINYTSVRSAINSPSVHSAASPSVHIAAQPINSTAQPINSPSVHSAAQPINSPSVHSAAQSINSTAQIHSAAQPINSPSVHSAAQPINSTAQVHSAAQPINSPSVHSAAQPINSPSVNSAAQPINQPINFPSVNSAAQPINSPSVNSAAQPIKKNSSGVIVAASVGSLLAFFLVVVCIIALIWRRNRYREVEDDDEFNMLPGLPTRFTFEDLKVATNDFLRKLGKGGFGSVFEGILIDGTKIAVKRLDSVGQGKKEFLAEVETIGNIHHIHLVRLVGFCAEKSYRLLVYEYMPNGSLDKWIFYKNHCNIVLDWQTRRKIIIGIVRGLAYLHEDCRQKIVHLDIKPRNILLNENFDAKVSDFGLAKLIDRNQIEVMTRMRGTPGYLAPEWLTSVITEKVDVFSFGVVVLEIVCGRRNLDYSKDEESVHLISLLQQKVGENKLVDIIDCSSIDMQLNIEDVTMVMHLAMWCLQSDRNKRPCMSVVLKVLEGSMNVEANLDYNFSNLAPYVSRNVNTVESVLPIASILSGPR